MTFPFRQALASAAMWHVPLVLAVAAACVAAGVSQPILSVQRFWIFSQPFSILDGIRALLDQGDWLVGGIIAVFSIVVPLAKVGLLFFLWWRTLRRKPRSARLLRILEYAGKWSMLDVLVLALMIFAVKTRPLIEADVGVAIYPFVGAIFLTAYAAHVIATRQLRSATPGHEDGAVS